MMNFEIVLGYRQKFFVGVFHAAVLAWFENVSSVVWGFHDGTCVITSPHFTWSWVDSIEQGLHRSSTGRWVNDVFFITSLITTRQNRNIYITNKQTKSTKSVTEDNFKVTGNLFGPLKWISTKNYPPLIAYYWRWQKKLCACPFFKL